ncbi:MAG: CehA/McbA family metallohydrolase [Gemmatimonadaceae bacterium]
MGLLRRLFGMMVIAAACAAHLASPVSLEAQREPVLRQIREPHAYYFREMYLPQLTSGPSAAAWSPDGATLVYSMGGTLWLQRLDQTVAKQLTDGPGYDYQPDWSPDGRWIVYASYRNDAMELRVVDPSSGADRSLVTDGNVNVEPRFSPDGKRLAWVSTSYEGRFHVFVGDFANGAVRAPRRVTDDVDSGLPRYYYSRYDHYISPSWSPDGTELLLISNKEKIWGSGGMWRIRSEPGASMRPVHDEETTWRARPDWSPDGKRVVYASYLGRQWHQLWLMTADGGDPLQLTYGDFDATNPRWSPNGRQVAYVSNEGGNTSLWVVSIPGGERRQVRALTRTWRAAGASLRVTVVDAGSGRLLAARVAVTSTDGRSWAPDDAWRHADDGFERSARRYEAQYFHADGAAELHVPADTLHIEVTRGLEYGVERQTMVVRAGERASVRVRLHRIANLPADGWFSGDLHVHMNYGGTYRNTPSHLLMQARAEDLHVVENLIVNKEGRIPDVSYFTGAPDPVSTSETIIAHDQEYHTSYWAHTALLGLTDHLILPGYVGYVNTAAASLFPLNSDVFDLAHRQRGVTGYVHPFDFDPDPADSTRALSHAFPVDVALGKVDYYEALGFADDYWATLKVWYRALNAGFRIPAGGGTDAMANFASLRGHIGMDRVFVDTRGPLTHRAFLDGLKAGRTFATNGPLVRLWIDGHGPGDEIKVSENQRTLHARVWMRSTVPMKHLEIVSNGTVVARVPLGAHPMTADTVVSLPVTGSAWYTLRAWSDSAVHPILDAFPLGTTSPVYVLRAGAPIRSAADARYFAQWVERLIGGAEQHAGWNSPAERDSALTTLRRARDEFNRRAITP